MVRSYRWSEVFGTTWTVVFLISGYLAHTQSEAYCGAVLRDNKPIVCASRYSVRENCPALDLNLEQLKVAVKRRIKAKLTFDCNHERYRECEANIAALHTRDNIKLSVPDLLHTCSQLRRNIDCLLNYTTRCIPVAERDRFSRLINDARKYALSTCEADDAIKSHWKDNLCFQLPQVKQCEMQYEEQLAKVPKASPPSDGECRAYVSFETCTRQTIGKNCSPENVDFVPLYLLDRGSRMAWLCSPDYHRMEPSAAALGGTPPVPCYKLIKDDIKNCQTQYKRRESQLLRNTRGRNRSQVATTDQDVRPKLCCAFGEFAHCMQTAVQRKCSQSREVLVDSILQQTLTLIGGHCEQYHYGSAQCSTATRLGATLLGITLASLVLLLPRWALPPS